MGEVNGGGKVMRGKAGGNTSDAGEFGAAEGRSELKMAVFAFGDEARGEEPV